MPESACRNVIERYLDVANQYLAHRVGVEVMPHIGELEAVRRGQRQDDIVFCGGRLQTDGYLATLSNGNSTP